jgi:hypothetical protein
MKVSLRKKSRWERAVEPITSGMKGKTLTLNGKAVTAQTAAKPAARAVGGLVIATVVSAVISSLRGQDDS